MSFAEEQDKSFLGTADRFINDVKEYVGNTALGQNAPAVLDNNPLLNPGRSDRNDGTIFGAATSLIEETPVIGNASRAVTDYANANAGPANIEGRPSNLFGTDAKGNFRRLFVEGPNGQTTADQVSTVDYAAGTRGLAEANAIRQATREANSNTPPGPANQITFLGGGQQVDPLAQRREALYRQFQNARDPIERNRAYRGLQLTNDQDRIETGADNTALTVQGATDRATIQAQQQLESGRAQRLEALANAAKTLQNLRGQFSPQQTEQIRAGIEAYKANPDPRVAQAVNESVGFNLIPVTEFANGGLVEPTMQRTMGTGAVGSFGAQGGNMEMMQRYTDYSTKAQELGLPLLSYGEFSKLAPQPKGFSMGGMVSKDVMGYAAGGMVDASGKQVVDPNPMAETDSIPAVIDGQQPAALDSGEFVIPKDVVMYYGTDKLTKMIEKARNPNGGQQSTTALGGTAAG